jgi:hypothetical protein
MDESRGGSRIVYPKLLATLTEADLVSQFRLALEERAWAGTVVGTWNKRGGACHTSHCSSTGRVASVGREAQLDPKPWGRIVARACHSPQVCSTP